MILMIRQVIYCICIAIDFMLAETANSLSCSDSADVLGSHICQTPAVHVSAGEPLSHVQSYLKPIEIKLYLFSYLDEAYYFFIKFCPKFRNMPSFISGKPRCVTT